MLTLSDDIAAYEYLVKQGLKDKEAAKLWEMYQREIAKSKNIGMQEDHFRASMQSIASQLSANKVDEALMNYDRIDSKYKLNSKQKAQLDALMAQYLE